MLGHFKFSFFLHLHDIYVAKFSPSKEIKSGGRDDCSKVEQSSAAELQLPLTAMKVTGHWMPDGICLSISPAIQQLSTVVHCWGIKELFRLKVAQQQGSPVLLILTVKFSLG